MFEVFNRKMHLIAHKSGVKQEWLNLSADLFRSKEFAEATMHNLPGIERNVKKEYEDTLTRLRQELATGNVSGNEGESPRVHKIAESIDNDLENAVADKDREVET